MASIKTELVSTDSVGTEFDDGPHSGGIKSISIRSARQIDAIKLTYVGGDGGEQYGGRGGKAREERLEDGEYVVEVYAIAHKRKDKGLQLLRFATDRGRTIAFDTLGTLSRGDERTFSAPPGHVAGGVHGRSTKFVNTIGVYWVPKPDFVKTELVSNDTGGNVFDDGPVVRRDDDDDGRIEAITVRAGAQIDGIRFVYSNTGAAADSGGGYYGGQGGNPRTEILKKGEDVVEVSATEHVDRNKGLEYLSFRTDKGRLIEFDTGFNRNDHGDRKTFRAPTGYVLGGLHGKADRFLHTMGVYWVPKKPTTTSPKPDANLGTDVNVDANANANEFDGELESAALESEVAQEKKSMPWHSTLLILSFGCLLIALVSPDWSQVDFHSGNKNMCVTSIGPWVHLTRGDGCRSGYHRHQYTFFCDFGRSDSLDNCGEAREGTIMTLIGTFLALLFVTVALAANFLAYAGRKNKNNFLASILFTVLSIASAGISWFGWTKVTDSIDDVLDASKNEASHLSVCFYLNCVSMLLLLVSASYDVLTLLRFADKPETSDSSAGIPLLSVV